MKATSHQEVYCLEVIVQGGMEISSQHLASKLDGYVKCNLCGAPLEGEIWPHVAYSCTHVANDFDNEATQETNPLRLVAAEDLRNKVNHALWLRGLRILCLPDPLQDDYLYENSWVGRLDISGCIVGHDGSGGKHARQIRTRRCGFGVAVVRLLADGSLLNVGTASWSVPGKQTVPRSEMTGLLHALMHTKGDAIFQCDNRRV